MGATLTFGLLAGVAFLWSGVASILRAQRIVRDEVASYQEYRRVLPGWAGAVRAEMRHPNHRWMRGRRAAWAARLMGGVGALLGLAFLYASLLTAQSVHAFGG